MNNRILIAIMLVILVAMKEDKPAYQIFNSEGKKEKYKDLLDDVLKSDIVFFGESHNNPICHWLELELSKDANREKEGKITFGAEMFETDNQLVLNEYLEGKIKTKSFEEDARLWKNYKTDYKPLVEFAREKKLRFIATNIPRRYASLVNSQGFEGLDSLPALSKKYIAPLPVKYDPELKGYKSMLNMEGMAGQSHATPNLPKAQAIKDATMAHFILENLEPGNLFIHFNGSYHSDNYEGILWYIRQQKPDLKILTISCSEQVEISSLDSTAVNLADYIIAVPETMTRTY